MSVVIKVINDQLSTHSDRLADLRLLRSPPKTATFHLSSDVLQDLLMKLEPLPH